MSDDRSKHWTEDEDLLTRYVLGRLHADERTSLEQHLGQCKQCADAVLAERIIVAGLKRAGREELKRRVADRIAERPSHGFNWYHAVGIAAAIVLLVTVAIRYVWFRTPEIQETEVQSNVDTVPPVVQPALEPQTGAGRTVADAEESRPREKAHAPAAGAGAALPEKDIEAKKLAAKEKTETEQRVVAMKEEERVLGKQQSALLSVASKSEELWVEGTLIRMKDASPYLDPSANVAAETKSIPLVAQTHATGGDTIPLRFSQLPLSALPQKRQRTAGSRAVQTLFSQGPAGLHITLYTDSLVTGRELQDARIRAIGADSLVLIIGSKQIGYKTPPGWLQQQAK